MSHPKLKILEQPPVPAEPTPPPVQQAPEPPLPTLMEADLDDVTYRSLWRDLEQLADIHEVKLKGGQAQRAAEDSTSLTTARRLLEEGSAYGVQIVYSYMDVMWCDTLLRTGPGIRLMRMEATL